MAPKHSVRPVDTERWRPERATKRGIGEALLATQGKMNHMENLDPGILG